MVIFNSYVKLPEGSTPNSKQLPFKGIIYGHP